MYFSIIGIRYMNMTLRTRLKLVWHQDATEVKTITDNVIPEKSWHWKVLHWSHINQTGHSWWWGILKSVSNLNPDWRGFRESFWGLSYLISAQDCFKGSDDMPRGSISNVRRIYKLQTENFFLGMPDKTNLIQIVDFFEQRMQILVFSKINSFTRFF